MITREADYIFTTFSPQGVVRVDGGIMPVRQHYDQAHAGANTMRILRGEDAAFIAEAISERKAASGEEANPSVTITKSVSSQPFSRAAQWMADHSDAVAAASTAWRVKPQTYVAFDSNGPTNLFHEEYGARVPAAQMSSSPNEWANARTLAKASVMNLYGDFVKFRHFALDPTGHTVSATGHSGSFSSNGENPSDTYQSRIANNLTSASIYLHRAVNFSESIFGNAYSGTATLESGTFSFSMPVSCNISLWGTHQAFVRMKTYRTDTAPTENYKWVPVASTINAQNRSVGISVAEMVGAAAVARNGFVPKEWGELSNGESQHIHQEATAFGIAVDLGDHTDVESYVRTL